MLHWQAHPGAHEEKAQVTDQESAYIKAIALAVADLQTRLTRLEAFALALNKRVRINEAGQALYEIQDDRREIH